MWKCENFIEVAGPLQIPTSTCTHGPYRITLIVTLLKMHHQSGLLNEVMCPQVVPIQKRETNTVVFWNTIVSHVHNIYPSVCI